MSRTAGDFRGLRNRELPGRASRFRAAGSGHQAILKREQVEIARAYEVGDRPAGHSSLDQFAETGTLRLHRVARYNERSDRFFYTSVRGPTGSGLRHVGSRCLSWPGNRSSSREGLDGPYGWRRSWCGVRRHDSVLAEDGAVNWELGIGGCELGFRLNNPNAESDVLDISQFN